MVDDVQRGHLVVFLAHDEEELDFGQTIGINRQYGKYLNILYIHISLTVSKNSVNLEK